MNGRIILSGANVLCEPVVQARVGSRSGVAAPCIDRGRQVFSRSAIVVLDVVETRSTKGRACCSGFSRILVFEDAAAFAAGTTQFAYTPRTPGDAVPVSSDLRGLGEGFVRFETARLISDDPQAPDFDELVVAGGRDLVREIKNGPVVFHRAASVPISATIH